MQSFFQVNFVSAEEIAKKHDILGGVNMTMSKNENRVLFTKLLFQTTNIGSPELCICICELELV